MGNGMKLIHGPRNKPRHAPATIHHQYLATAPLESEDIDDGVAHADANLTRTD